MAKKLITYSNLQTYNEEIMAYIKKCLANGETISTIVQSTEFRTIVEQLIANYINPDGSVAEVVEVATYEDLTALSAPQTEVIYITLDTNTLYIYNKGKFEPLAADPQSGTIVVTDLNKLFDLSLQRGVYTVCHIQRATVGHSTNKQENYTLVVDAVRNSVIVKQPNNSTTPTYSYVLYLSNRDGWVEKTTDANGNSAWTWHKYAYKDELHTYTAGENINISNEDSGDGLVPSQETISAVGYKYNQQNQAFSEGSTQVATAEYAHGEGKATAASGIASHAEGWQTSATGGNTHAEGNITEAAGKNSHAEGKDTHAMGESSHTEGYGNRAVGVAAHAEGWIVEAIADNAHAEGNKTAATGKNAHAEGKQTSASGQSSHAEGEYTIASGKLSHAEGSYAHATNSYAHAEGNATSASGESSHAEGYGTSAIGTDSHAEGNNTKANAYASHAEGTDSIANGERAHAEGYGVNAIGIASHAEGSNTKANASNSHAEGIDTIADGENAHAEGYGVNAIGFAAHAEGFGESKQYEAGRGMYPCYPNITSYNSFSLSFDYAKQYLPFLRNGQTVYNYQNGQTATISYWSTRNNDEITVSLNNSIFGSNTGTGSICFPHQYNLAKGRGAHLEGHDNTVDGDAAHAEGDHTKAFAVYTHSEGSYTSANGNSAHSEGYSTKANGSYSHAEGKGTIALQQSAHSEGEDTIAFSQAHAEGYGARAIGVAAHAEGRNTQATAEGAHAEGKETQATGEASHAEGNNTKAYNNYAHAEGFETTAEGWAAHTEGCSTEAISSYDHAEGYATSANGSCAHAEGNVTKAFSTGAHAEGSETKANNYAAHAEGNYSEASGYVSHAEGYDTRATGSNAHAEGESTTASEIDTHAEGMHTIAASPQQHAQGRYNIEDKNGMYAHIVGGGQSDDTRKNIHTLDWEGNAEFAGDVTGVDANGKTHKLSNKIEATDLPEYKKYRFGTNIIFVPNSQDENDITIGARGYYYDTQQQSFSEGETFRYATGQYSHTEGYGSRAIGISSHAENGSTSKGAYSHSEGAGTIATGDCQHVQGKYNIEDTNNKYAHIVGNGTSETDRKNIHTLDWSGNAEFAGDVTATDTNGQTHKLSDKLDREGVISLLTSLGLYTPED